MKRLRKEALYSVLGLLLGVVFLVFGAIAPGPDIIGNILMVVGVVILLVTAFLFSTFPLV